jgi:DnaJ-class molecular chaperone
MENKIKCRICRGHGFILPKDGFICNRMICTRCLGTGYQENTPPKLSTRTTQKYIKRDADMERLKNVKAL